MKSTQQLTAIIERDGDGYVSLCPELDIASQGDNIEAARQNLIEALELFFETADSSEVQNRLHSALSTNPTQPEVANVLHSVYAQSSQ
ncbi:type II toxin-antitoxin system HicB family antitoxin [Microcoleus sp. Z1_A1]|uniref:type II toxin-antitoxin system HicB family antitoxin n=1 Tax=unclassified Microcoleus TaxID=2642155 RepID=UPI002FD59422